MMYFDSLRKLVTGLLLCAKLVEQSLGWARVMYFDSVRNLVKGFESKTFRVKFV